MNDVGNISNLKEIVQRTGDQEEMDVLKIYFGGPDITYYPKHLSVNPNGRVDVHQYICGTVTGRNYQRNPYTLCDFGYATKEDLAQDVTLARKLGRIICRLGFDGWINYGYLKMTRTDFGLRLRSEIMLCDRKKIVEVVNRFK
jgi:hypothetical protein